MMFEIEWMEILIPIPKHNLKRRENKKEMKYDQPNQSYLKYKIKTV